MRHIVISDCERPEQTAPIARAYGVGLECTTFYDPNFLPEHPGGIDRKSVCRERVCWIV